MYDFSHILEKGMFGERLRKARKNQGLTQDDLAEKLHLAQRSSISDWENGKKLPDIATISKLCKELNIDSGYLLGDYNEKTFSNHQIAETLNLSEDAISCLRSDSFKADFISWLLSDNKTFSDFLEVMQTMNENYKENHFLRYHVAAQHGEHETFLYDKNTDIRSCVLSANRLTNNLIHEYSLKCASENNVIVADL